MLQSGRPEIMGRGQKTPRARMRLRGEERNWEIWGDGRIRMCHGSSRILLKADRLKAKIQKQKDPPLPPDKPGSSQSRPTEAMLK